MEQLVLYFALKYKGDFQSIYNALLREEPIDEQLCCELKKKLDCKYTTIFSKDYPEQLKLINCPPFVLFYYGDLSLVSLNPIGVIGTHEASLYGIQATNHFVEGLVNKGYTIVSGMAQGIDTIAHQSTINKNGKTIAVLGTGIEYCYPRENQVLYEELKKSHLVLSEYPYDVYPQHELFPFRNRIISGLSNSVLICESRLKSETMITAGYALEQGKEIYCIPGNFDNDHNGCNELIKQGANLVTCIEDIEAE